MRLSFVLLFVLTIFHSFAQENASLEFFAGPELEEQKGSPIVQTFGHSDDFFFAVRSDRRNRGNQLIEKISVDSLTVTGSVAFAPRDLNGVKPEFAYPFSTKDASFLISTAEDPDGTKIYFLAYRITDDLKIAEPPVTLGIGNREALLSEDGFLLFKSENEEKIALFIPQEKDPARNEKFNLRYFDSTFALIEAKNIEIPYTSGEVYLEDGVLSSNGTFHGIISLRKELEQRVLPDSYALLSYDPVKEGLKEKALALGTKWFYDLKLTLTPDSNLWLAGYYSNMVEPSMAGTFSVVIDFNTGDLLNTGLSPFERDFRLLFRGNKDDEDGLGQFQLDDTYLKTDGKLSLLSEKRFVRSSTIFNPATGTYSVINVNNYEELLISKIKPSSEIVQNILIPKYQSSSRETDRYASYVALHRNDDLIVFYNDHIRNIALSPTENNEYRSLNNENNIVITYCMVKDGNLVKDSIDPASIGGYYLNADHHYQTEKGHVLTLYKGYKTRYIRVLAP